MRFMITLLSYLFIGCAPSFIDVADKTLPTVVKIETQTDTYKSGGSGVFISKYGHILTAAHVVADPEVSIDVQVYGAPYAWYSARVVLLDSFRDLALLKIKYRTRSYAKLRLWPPLEVGEPVLAIGHPLWLEWTVTHGIISRLNNPALWVQNDAAVNPGNSGGPLFDMQGRLIGINTHLYTTSPFATSVGLSVAASPSSINSFLSTLRGIN